MGDDLRTLTANEDDTADVRGRRPIFLDILDIQQAKQSIILLWCKRKKKSVCGSECELTIVD